MRSMTVSHSTIETTGVSARVRRFECPACGFTLELHGNVPREVRRGDSGVAHTGSGWQLAYR